MKIILFTLCTFLAIGSAWAQSTMPSDAIDLASGALYLKSSGYAIGATGNTVTTHTGEYDIYTSATTANKIIAEAGPQTVNLWNVNFSTSVGYFFTNSVSVDLKVNCYGDNYLTNPGSQVFFKFSSTTTVPTFTLSGDKLTTSNNSYSLATSSYYNYNIILNIKYLYMTCTSSSVGYAIGVGTGTKIPSITINDDVVLTINNGCIGSAKTITLGKASIKLNGGSFLTTPVNSSGEDLYCVTVPRNGTHTIAVKNNTSGTSTNYTFTYEHPNDDNYYLYLPNGSYTLTSNGIDYNAEVNSAGVTASLAPKSGDGNIDVSTGTVTIYDGGYQIGSQPYTYTGKVFTLSGTTLNNTVTITGGADTVKLNGVDIEPTGGCALNINTGTDLTVVLNEGTSNTLISPSPYAGLQKSQTAGMLTIKGSGSLLAHSGATSKAAGIGSAANASCANITIEGGNITASAYESAGAIGAGVGGTTSNILIKGGNLTLSTGTYALPIGGYSGSSASGIVISGGRISLTSGGSHYNSYLLTNVTITGGTVYGKVIEDGVLMSSMSSGCIFTGGSVNMVDTAGAVILTSDTHPTNGTTTDYLYRSQFLIPGITSATAVGSITVDGNAWGCKDVFTNETGMVYLWLPKDDASTYETTKVIIAVGDKTYNYSGQIDALDNIVAATASVAAQGNYFYQIPVSITSSHASVTVADAEGNSISDGSFIGSGTLDDNKPRLAVTATADEGYNAPVVSVTNLDKGSKYYKVTASENQTVSIDASAAIQTFPVTFQSVHGAVTVVASDTSVLSDEWLNYGTSVRISTTPDDHYQFDSLLVNGVKVTDGAATINSAAIITAYFSLVKFSVSIVGENGIVEVKAGETSIGSGYAVDFGTTLSISATPNTGYRLDSMMVNGRKVTENTYTLTGNITVSAMFSKISTATAVFTENTTLVYASDRTIYVEAATGSNISIYSVTGQLIASGMSGNSLQSFVLPCGGLYLVKVSSAGRVKTTKCLVR